MPDDPLVSAIVPTLDRPQLVERAVESIDAQTYSNIEIVVVDDSDYVNESPPSFEGIETDLTYLDSGSPEGLPTARNRGIDAASGDLFAFLDDDDVWKPEKTTKQVQFFQNETVGLCTSWRYMVDSVGDIGFVAEADIDGDLLRKLLCRNVVGPPSGVLVGREVIETIGKFDERFLLWEDREWYLRVAREYDIGCVETPLIRYAMESPGKMSGNLEMARRSAYPQLLAKHSDLVERYGRRYVDGWKFRKFGKMAYDAGNRGSAIRYSLSAIASCPSEWPFYRLLLRSVLGEQLYGSLNDFKSWAEGARRKQSTIK
ncbi:glycosyltransferase family 2 protein [Haladaptatus sp. DFWS20]|uniref:glycosyltransferase family 2 protein n=1 Tax=Haladaptatus sp. DFWS20 TaxID=3403467 RepID=UPI003EB70E20